MTAVVLSLILVFTMMPATTFAASEDITVYFTVANYNFTKEMKSDSGNMIKPAWTGEKFSKIPVTIPVNGNAGDAVPTFSGIKYTDSTWGKYFSEFFGLSGGLNVNTGTQYDVSGWVFTHNKISSSVGISYYVNKETPGSGEVKLSDGDEIGFYYSVDGATIFTPYLFMPSSVTAKSSYNSTTLNWKGYDSPKDNWNNDALYNKSTYEIYRATTENGTYNKVGSVDSYKADNSYVDQSVKTGTEYFYKIRTVKTNNNASEFSNIVKSKPTLNKPVINKVTKKGKKSFKVSWKKVDGATRYQVYRATKKNGKYKKVKTVSAKKLSWTNKKLKKGKKYFYKVRAVIKVDNKNVYSSFSKIKSKKR